MIETFDNLDDVFHYILSATFYTDFLKAEIYKTTDGRYRVGIILKEQLELPI